MDGGEKDPGHVSEVNCPICKKPLLQGASNVYQKGLKTLIKISNDRGDLNLLSYFQSREELAAPIKVRVHASCRKDYTHPQNVTVGLQERHEDEPEPSPKKLRSSVPPFTWIVDCLFCGNSACVDSRHYERDPVFYVRTLTFRETVLKQCEKRNDWLFRQVRARITSCICLVAVEARYHHRCYLDFYRDYSDCNPWAGRPIDDRMRYWFLSLCHWIENDSDAELYMIDDLMETMVCLAAGEDVYCKRTLREKLKTHYGDHIFFAKVSGGKQDVLCFRDMASFIVHKQWYADRQEDLNSELARIVVTCARLIKEKIREQQYNRDYYPSTEDIKDNQQSREFLTPCLKILLENLFTNDLKRNSIGQMITQAVRPKSVIAPLMFGLGVEIDFVFRSQWLIDELFSLGMSVSYDEVRLYKQSILQDDELCNVLMPPNPVFSQWGEDNADASICTLTCDGHFHAIGMCAMSAVPKLPTDNRKIRHRARIPLSELLENKGIPVIKYIGPTSSALSKIKFEPVIQSMRPHLISSITYHSHVLWQSARLLSLKPVPNWSGYMEYMFRERNAEKWQVTILPILDLNPNDETGIYSFLQYIQDQGDKLNVPCYALTFDQLLWLKATEIVEAKNMTKFVIRLGGFHLLMSAIGSMLHVMKGSGIEKAIEQVYGENVVKHIVSGKAYSRAVRANILIESALMTKLVSKVLPNTNSAQFENEHMQIDDENADETSEHNRPVEIDGDDVGQLRLNSDELRELKSLVDQIGDDSFEDRLNEVAESAALQKLDTCLQDLKTKLATNSRTAKLWILYLYHVDCIKDFIRAERMCDWEGHLNAVGKLLNVFAATNHIYYAKSARLYLQRMRKLPDTHSWLYEKFAVQPRPA